MTKLSLKALLASTAIVAVAGAASAQQSGGISGYGGLGFSIHTGENVNDNDEYAADGLFAEGGFSYGLGMGTLYVMSAYTHYNSSDLDEDPFDFENAGYGFNVSGHYLYDLNQATSVGGFVAYGMAVPDGDEADFWTYYGVGAEVQHAFSPMLTGYAQLAIYNAENDDGDNDALGVQNSPFLRAGINYNLTSGTTLYADVQLASLLDFEDEGEDWRWSQLSIGGETLIDGTNFGITYDLSLYEAIPFAGGDADDLQNAATASIGVRYYFGNQGSTARSQGLIGAPTSASFSALFPDMMN